MIEELQVDLKKPHPRNLQFPQMDMKTEEEMERIISKLWSGKAITWDGVSDSIFHGSMKDKSKRVFADLWNNLNLVDNKHFEARILPFSKSYPNIGTRVEMKPITIMSPVAKLIEAGILPELTDSMIN